MFLPVRMVFGPGAGQQSTIYNRGIELTTRQLAAFEHEAADMSAPLSRVGKDLRTQVEMAFATEGASGATGKWTVLSDNPAGHGYASWKEQHAPGTPILVGLRRTTGPVGRRQGQHPGYGPSGEMRFELLDPLATYISPRRLLYAPRSDIAGYHETGTPDMPARPPVDVSLRFLHSVDRAFAVWLAGMVKKLGL